MGCSHPHCCCNIENKREIERVGMLLVLPRAGAAALGLGAGRDGIPVVMGSQRRWGSLREGQGDGESRTPSVTSTSLHCFPTSVFPHDLILPWLSLVILWQGSYVAVKGKQSQAILFPPVFIGVFVFCSRHSRRVVGGKMGVSVCRVCFPCSCKNTRR